MAAVWTFLVGIAGAPGAALPHYLAPNEDWHDGSGNVSKLGLEVCVVGQSYVALGFSAILVAFTTQLLRNRPDLIGWIMWTVVFCGSGLPAYFALKAASRKEEKKTQDVATTFTLLVSLVGFWVFVLFPSVMNAGWGWIPYVDRS